MNEYKILMNSKTPETNDLARGNHVVPIEWAEQLERERDEANVELNKQLVKYDALFDEADKIRKERDEVMEVLMRIQGATCTLHTDDERSKMHCPICLERERDEAREELENYTASTTHSCHDQCQRPMCFLRRERDEARAKVDQQRERIAYLEGATHHEGATNHACGTPLTIALRAALVREQLRIAVGLLSTEGLMKMEGGK